VPGAGAHTSAMGSPADIRPECRTTPLLRLDRIGRVFPNGTAALDGVDLDLYRGEFLSIIGPSGCGKSTILRLIAGLDGADRGTLAWRDGTAPGIGYVFQDATLMPWADAFANVWLPLRLRGVSRRAAADRVAAALDLVGLSAFAGHKPHQLSGGMRMRVSIARALVTQPALLLMDEPFAALDEITRFRLNDELIALRERLGTTVVFVTHSIFEAVYLSSRVVVMSARPGRVVESVDVPFEIRDADLRASPAYAALCGQVSSVLHRAAANA
jgi:NitT/TauT family transport system ATP-binding protein